MPITYNFNYCKPATLDEALKLLAQYGDKARILAGGTDLVVKIKEDLETPDVVIDIKGLGLFNTIEQQGNNIHIGALVTFTELIHSELIQKHLPMIYQAAKTVASVGIRNRATIVGNICSAVPSLDSGPALLTYEAIVVVKSAKGERTIPIGQWFAGPKKTNKRADEIVTEIIVPVPQVKHVSYYGKQGRYSGEDLAQAGIGILGFADGTFRIAFCAVGPVATRSLKLETLLNGQTIDAALIEKCKKLIEEEITPITDIRSSKEYRMHMVKVMFERGLREVIERLS